MTRLLVLSVPVDIANGLQIEVLRRHPGLDLTARIAVADAIRITWKSAAQYQERTPR